MNKQPDIGDIEKLLDIMARLRDPRSGCPWDLEQTFGSIAPYTIEEAYEVADAIERNDVDELAVELGDLLFQVVFHARLAEETGAFSFADVTRHICEKMLRRHPHVFDGDTVSGSAGHTQAWEAMKRQEKSLRPGASELDGVALGLPGLTRAVKLGRRASGVGFDWPDAVGPRAKIDEELAELDEAVAAGERDRIESELGDVLFAVANLARHLRVDPERCARAANRRFDARFRHVEEQVRASGRSFEQHSADELESYWSRAKTATG
jgi:nucleoside triphosphate diphosphatase